VTIRVNGQAVGEGQLVDMDGRLGVMVSRLSVGGLG
jgi:flagellar motor switch/type III secretory pathway protein FliN